MSSVVNANENLYANDDVKPEPLPRSTSLIGKVDEVITVQPLPREPRKSIPDMKTIVSPCYSSPQDLKSDDDTINRYTPPADAREEKDIPTVHQKHSKSPSNVTKTVISSSPEYGDSSSERLQKIKRKAPTVPVPEVNNKDRNSPNSSVSSLDSSSSSGSSGSSKSKEKHHNTENEARELSANRIYSNDRSDLYHQNNLNNNQNVQHRRPDYQNIPKRSKVKENSGYGEVTPSEDGDYEQDMVVYEAITVSNDMIELVSRNSSGTESTNNKKSRKVRGSSSSSNGSSSNNSSIDNMYVKSRNKLNNELTSKLSDCDVSNVKKSIKHYENLVMMENKKKVNKLFINNSDDDNDHVLRSAGSSLSLNSQDTVKENNHISSKIANGRRSPDGQASEEREIIPNRQRVVPKNISVNGPNAIKFFEFESPTETSDTETLARTIETESTRSFGFIKPERNLHRRDTMHEGLADRSDRRDDTEKLRRNIRRSESFQAGDSSDLTTDSPKMKRLGSTDTLIDSGCGNSPDLCINGRAFTKYSADENNVEANELLKAALSRRQCRSVEDRLDQWLEEDLKRISTTKDASVSKAKEFSRSVSSYEERQTEKIASKNDKILNNRKLAKSRNPLKRYSNGDLMAFKGFVNQPLGSPPAEEGDYGRNFVLNRPLIKRKTEFLGEKAEFGIHDFPIQKLKEWSNNGEGKWKNVQEFDPAIPTPDYVVTPAGTLTAAMLPAHARHILDIPSGLY